MEPGSVGRWGTNAAIVALAIALSGCTVPVAAGMEEPDANRVVLALDRAGIDASKEADPTAEGKFRVTVARDDAASALGAMVEEELPRPKPRGVLDAMDKGALVPSPLAEHAQLVAGLAGDLEHTLTNVDGVLSARVHLNLPAKDPLRDTAPPRTTASVLIEHRGSTPPIANDAVQRLVAGGISGLAPQDVSVVTVSRVTRPISKDRDLAHVGPIAVARGSMRLLQLSMVALVALVAVFAAATLFLYTRLAKLKGDAPPQG